MEPAQRATYPNLAIMALNMLSIYAMSTQLFSDLTLYDKGGLCVRMRCSLKAKTSISSPGEAPNSLYTVDYVHQQDLRDRRVML